MRGAGILIAGLLVLALVLVAMLGRGGMPEPARVSWRAESFADLKGWTDDDHLAAIAAFSRSCERIDILADDATLGPYGRAAEWRGACALARTVTPGDRDGARRFFEATFTPLRVSVGGKENGLFTGYYEPELQGSRTEDARFHVPLLGRPPNLLTADLGLFQEALKGQRVTGRVDGNRFVPYAERGEIEANLKSDPNYVPVLFVDDPVAAFFLQIQGSGRVALTDGSVIRVGYLEQNGRPYTAIGRVLIEKGALQRGKTTMSSIRAWLATNPGEARTVMNANASYVFFRELTVDDPLLGPPGAEGVPLTPGRSLAVDRKIHALGVPMWIETDPSPPEVIDRVPPLARLMVAQDTGGAIRGAVRGDVFYGFGPAAEDLAGAMQASGRLSVLVPKTVAKQLLNPPSS